MATFVIHEIRRLANYERGGAKNIFVRLIHNKMDNFLLLHEMYKILIPFFFIRNIKTSDLSIDKLIYILCNA